MGSKRSTRFGLRLPTFAIGEKTEGLGKIIPYVEEAERLGFESFFLIDHTLRAKPAYACSWLEPVAVLGSLAAVTKKAILGPLVLAIPFRHPLMLAKSFATLDVLSNGRVVYGVGVGWSPDEFDSFGISLSQRGAITDESIEVVRRLWTQDDVIYEGKFYKIKNVSLEPKPIQKPYPPIWVGGGSLSLAVIFGMPPPNVQRVLRRVARVADVWVPQAVTVPEVLKNDWRVVRQYAMEAGRNPDEIRVAYSNFCYILRKGESPEVAKPLFGQYSRLRFDEQKDHYLVGTPEEIVKRVKARTEITEGVDHCVFSTLTYDYDQLHLLADEVIPALQRQ